MLILTSYPGPPARNQLYIQYPRYCPGLNYKSPGRGMKIFNERGVRDFFVLFSG